MSHFQILGFISSSLIYGPAVDFATHFLQEDVRQAGSSPFQTRHIPESIVTEEIAFDDQELVKFASGDCVLISPNGKHRIKLHYAGEPPHGDFFHTISIDNVVFPGFAWGGYFAYSSCSRYAAFSWMPQQYARMIAFVDLDEKIFFVPPFYFTRVSIDYPKIRGDNETYIFNGNEKWASYPQD